MNTSTSRFAMLAQFDLFARAFLNILSVTRPFGVNVGALTSWVAKVRSDLEHAPFIGLVVRVPPPLHLHFDLVVDVQRPDAAKRHERRQNPAFVRWFRGLSRLEVKTPQVQGAIAYRIVEIHPQCRVEKVRFSSKHGWLTEAEWLASRRSRHAKKA